MKKPFGGAFKTDEAPKTPAFDPLSSENLDKTEKFIDFYDKMVGTLNARARSVVKEIKGVSTSRHILTISLLKRCF